MLIPESFCPNRETNELINGLCSDPILQRIYLKWIENGMDVAREGLAGITEEEVRANARETAWRNGALILRNLDRLQEAEVADLIAASFLSDPLFQEYKRKENEYLKTHDRNGRLRVTF